jgi:integrase
MCIGELLALSWEDIDFEKQCVSVTKTLTYYKEDQGNVFFA